MISDTSVSPRQRAELQLRLSINPIILDSLTLKQIDQNCLGHGGNLQNTETEVTTRAKRERREELREGLPCSDGCAEDCQLYDGRVEIHFCLSYSTGPQLKTTLTVIISPVVDHL